MSDSPARMELEKLARLAGYRFVLREITHDKSVSHPGTLNMKMKWANVGVAKLYRPFNLQISLRNSAGETATTTTVADADPRDWLPGERDITASVPIPCEPILFLLPCYQIFGFPNAVLLDAAIERLYDLNVGVVGVAGERHERPHKPLLLLAVFDLIDEGLATPDRIPWCRELRDRFTARFDLVQKHDDQNSPENPFFYLRNDGFWLATKLGPSGIESLQTQPLVGDMGKVFARFTDGFEFLAAIPENRRKMSDALVTRYFPHHAADFLKGVPTPVEPFPSAKVADDEFEFGRSPAFRRKILEIYDHQCAACGLRIKLPAAQDVSFIDAAHLIPFAESHNDHPTNGLALCKNHHWAMDRNLIVPAPDHQWHVSPILDPRRSTGEKELQRLSGKSLLLPQDQAFHPDPEGLKWRSEKLIA